MEFFNWDTVKIFYKVAYTEMPWTELEEGRVVSFSYGAMAERYIELGLYESFDVYDINTLTNSILDVKLAGVTNKGTQVYETFYNVKFADLEVSTPESLLGSRVWTLTGIYAIKNVIKHSIDLSSFADSTPDEIAEAVYALTDTSHITPSDWAEFQSQELDGDYPIPTVSPSGEVELIAGEGLKINDDGDTVMDLTLNNFNKDAGWHKDAPMFIKMTEGEVHEVDEWPDVYPAEDN